MPPGMYRCESYIDVPADKTLRGGGELTVLFYVNTTQTEVGVVQSAGPGGRVCDLTIDGGNARTSKPQFLTYGIKFTHDDFKVENVTVCNWRRRAIYGQSCKNGLIQDCDFLPAGASTTIVLYACQGARVLNNDTSGNPTNFAIYLNEGTNGCLIMGNYCNNADLLALGTRSLEPIGIISTTFNNMIIGNHCEGSGDNGISLTGFDNVCMGNTVVGNYHNGIIAYGEGNIIVGNRCHANGKRFATDGTSFPNIHIQPAFGGRGRRVVVHGNVCSDGPNPTAERGVKISGNSHLVWAAGKLFTPGNAYCYFGNNVYKSTFSVNTNAGNTAPTHTSGTVSDGVIDWTYLFSGEPDLNPRLCSVNGNPSYGHRVSDLISDLSGNQENEVIDSGAFVRGATSVRPNLDANAVGRQFYDATLGKPIWWTGSAWKDAAGTTV